MKKQNVRIKENITMIDKINAINDIVDKCFEIDELGFSKYTPYYRQMGIIISIIENCFEGITFEENDNVYEIVPEDVEIKKLLDEFGYTNEFDFITTNADEMIEFRKQEILNNNAAIFANALNEKSAVDEKIAEILDKELKRIEAETKAINAANRVSKEQAKQLEYANRVNELFTPEETAELTRKMSEGDYDPYTIANIVAEKYNETSKHKSNVKSIVDHKKNKKTAKNVLVDKKDE